ncbi:MAG: hypothetical protein K2O52_04535, partial [Oscillospiraceae bacterium]|nr:hypothetical protein [Oscillospiraceae bacterium]
VYSCYSINISKETGCYISTKFKDIPLHLGCGVGDFEETIKQKDVDNIRSTWALNPAILDCISFKDFVSIKKKLMNIPYRSLIMEFLNGTLKEDNLDLFYSAWENYTMCLEEMMRESLMKSQVQIYEKLMELSSVKLKHRTVLSESWEVVESLIERAPIVGDVLGVTDMGNTLLNCIRNISHKEEWNRLIDRKEDISKLLSPDTKIITKY